MKLLVLFGLVAATYAVTGPIGMLQQQANSGLAGAAPTPAAGAGTGRMAGAGVAGTGGRQMMRQNTGLGNLVYGVGVNNPWAMPVNRFAASQMSRMAQAYGMLVRVDLNGDMTMTDRFGREVDGFEYENELGDFPFMGF